jgi:hypothetical protein
MMEVSYRLLFVTLTVGLYLPNLYGASDCGEEWVDPDPLSKINRDRASEPVTKEPRFVIFIVCIMPIVTLDTSIRNYSSICL